MSSKRKVAYYIALVLLLISLLFEVFYEMSHELFRVGFYKQITSIINILAGLILFVNAISCLLKKDWKKAILELIVSTFLIAVNILDYITY